MNKELQQELRERLATLNGRERKELNQRAADLRARAQKRKGDPQARWTIEDFQLQHLRQQERFSSPATVIAVSGKRCRLLIDGEESDAQIYPTIQCVVGDEVRLDAGFVRDVMPRRTSLERRDPHYTARKLTIVANVEVVIIVVSAVAPPFHPRLIDRYLAAIWKGGAEPMIVLNKVDLYDSDEAREEDRVQLEPYREMGIPVFEVSAAANSGLSEVREALQGRVAVFVGHSGVGKSSVVNGLLPDADAETGRVSDGTGKGRHTTTGSAMHRADGLKIIDTPGVREFGVEFTSPAEVAECFREFPVGCRFSDCTHLHEESCAVRSALATGEVSRARYDSYRRLVLDAFPQAGHPPDQGFECRNCGAAVSAMGGGTKHRNHCPLCLHSVHLDDVPGDRLAGCSGVMEPVAVWVRKDGEWAVIHRCRKCGQFGSNRIASDDNEMLLMSLAVRPLSMPPFPLERLTMG